jgi:hypothetical protein
VAGNTGEARTGIPEGLEWKGIGSGNGGLLAADEATGIVEAIVSVTGIVDEVKDIIEPGAYAETLRQRTPKGISGHDWGKLAAKTLDIKELLPGDPALPRETPDGKPWPAAAGALWVKAQYNLATQIGRDCFANIQFFGPETQWSIGYDVPAGKSVRGRDGTRRIKGLRLFEYSDVLFGAAPLTGTLSAKDAKPSDGDADNDLNSWTTDDPEDAITQEADADDPDMAALHAAAISEINAQAQGWDAIDAASAINAGEEEITDATADDLQAADQRRQGATATAGTKAAGGATTTPAGVSDTPWSDFTAADYTPAQWHKACLIHNHAPGEVPDTKGDCKLPVRQPDGRVNVNGVHAAAGVLAGARGGVDATAGQKRIAAAQLRGLYRKIGDTPPSSLQAKVLTSADVTGTPPTGPSGPIQLRARLDGWAGGDPADYSTAQWHDATLIHNHPDGMMPTDKGDCSLPVCTPDGALSSQGMHAAAGALGSGDLDATDDQKTQAATALLMLFRRTGEAPPPIQVKVAGQDVTPADARATQRLKDWYVHGGGAAQIGWGVAGDFDKCVAIAGKHMDPAKAKGYCQLRHKDATGFYAGHAPSEELAHGAAAAITDGTKAAGINLSGGYNPALETGPYAGWRSPETKDIGDAGDMPGSIEETLDNVSDAVTAALGGSDTTTGGLPRWIVTVNGTWPDHVIATRYDTTGDLDDGESFSIAYTTDPDTGDVTLGEQTPVTLTVVAEPSDGTKSIGDGERLSAVPILVEYVTGFVRRGLQVKQGRVLSEVNGKLLRGAVSQLIAVLNAAGIPLDTPPDDQPDQQDQALATTGAEPLYLPDSTAPGAQVVEGKSLVGPRDMARQLRITAAAYGADGDAE